MKRLLIGMLAVGLLVLQMLAAEALVCAARAPTTPDAPGIGPRSS